MADALENNRGHKLDRRSVVTAASDILYVAARLGQDVVARDSKRTQSQREAFRRSKHGVAKFGLKCILNISALRRLQLGM